MNGDVAATVLLVVGWIVAGSIVSDVALAWLDRMAEDDDPGGPVYRRDPVIFACTMVLWPGLVVIAVGLGVLWLAGRGCIWLADQIMKSARPHESYTHHPQDESGKPPDSAVP